MPKKILFLLGSADLSGGTYVILQHASYLANAGYDVSVALVYMTLAEFEKLKDSDKCWHPALKTLQFMHVDDCQQVTFDVAIFTWWATLLSFNKINTRATIYFVQSIESRFYGAEEVFVKSLADKTYQLNLPIITEATWIKKYLEEHYQASVFLAKNGILKSVYTPTGIAKAEKDATKLRVLVEGPVERFFKNVKRTIELCQQAEVDEIWLLTSSDLATYPGVDKVFSRIPLAEVAEVYRSCDVLVKLSFVEGMFGPPLEIFHCGGTAIVYAVTGYDEYIEHNYNALVAVTHDEQAVISYLQALKNDKQLLARLQSNAKTTADAWLDWEPASEHFMQMLEQASLESLTSTQISSNIYKLFSQQLLIKTVVNNEIKTQEVHARDLYDNAHYSLAIPLPQGQSSSTIYFGKSYSQFKLTNISFPQALRNVVKGSIRIDAKDMVQEANQLFKCISKDAELTLHADIVHLSPSPECFINLEFAVIS